MVAQLVEALRYMRKGAGSIPDGVNDIILRPQNGAGVDLAYNRNKYQEYFPGG